MLAEIEADRDTRNKSALDSYKPNDTGFKTAAGMSTKAGATMTHFRTTMKGTAPDTAGAGSLGPGTAAREELPATTENQSRIDETAQGD